MTRQVYRAGGAPPFNPSPRTVQTPLQPGGPRAALERLAEGADGKTPVVKKFQLDWVRSLAERGEPAVYTRSNSKNFEYIGQLSWAAQRRSP